MIPLDGAGKGQADAGVAAGGLDQGIAGFDASALFSILNHGHAHTVLDGAEGIEHFKLDVDFGLGRVDPVQPHERCVAKQLSEIVCDFHMCSSCAVSVLTSCVSAVLPTPASAGAACAGRLFFRYERISMEMPPMASSVHRP